MPKKGVSERILLLVLFIFLLALGFILMAASVPFEGSPEGSPWLEFTGSAMIWVSLVAVLRLSSLLRSASQSVRALFMVFVVLSSVFVGLMLSVGSFTAPHPPNQSVSFLTAIVVLVVCLVAVPVSLYSAFSLPKDLYKPAGSFSVQRGSAQRGAKVASIGVSMSAASGGSSGKGYSGKGSGKASGTDYAQFRKWFKLTWVLLGLIIFFLFFNPIVVIPAGYVGVIYNAFGGIDFDTIMTPGWNLRVPVLQNVHKVYVERHSVSLLESGGNDIEVSAPTKEGLVVEMDVTVLFKMKPERAPRVLQELSAYYLAGTIIPEVRSISREVTGDMSVTELYGPGREKMEERIFEGLKPLFERDGFIIEDVLIRKLDLPQMIVTAIEQKQATEQAVLQKQFEVDLARKEAERKKIEAEGIANYKIEVAKGEADALRQVAQAIKGNPEVLKSKQLDVTQDLYKNPNVKWVLPSDQLIYPLNFETGNTGTTSATTTATQ